MAARKKASKARKTSSKRQPAPRGSVISPHMDALCEWVAHGGTLSAYLAGLLELDFLKRQPWMLDNASLSAVIVGGVRHRIALLNDTCHLLLRA